MHKKNPQSHQENTAQRSPRGGLGNKGSPFAIKYSITEAVKDIQRTNHDLEKIQRDKDELIADLADLRIREKEAEENNLSKNARDLIKKNVLNIQRKLNELNGILPEVNLPADQKKIQNIINEWNEAKKEKKSALAAQTKAEAMLAKDPSNMKAMGQANRASATIYENTQKMERAFNEARIVKEKSMRDPALDESVNIHTGEEEELKGRLATQNTVSAPSQRVPFNSPPPRADKDKENEQKHNKTAIERDPARDEGISYTHKQSLADHEKYRAAGEPTQNAPLSTENAEVSKEATKQNLNDNAHQKEKDVSYAEATKNLLQQMNRALIKNKVALETIQKRKEEMPVFVLKPADNHLLLNNKDHIPQSRITSLKKALRDSFAVSLEKQPAKKEKVSSLIEDTLSRHLNIVFGEKGFLGFGARAGTDSPHWKDPSDGFAKKTPADIFAAHPNVSQKNALAPFGIKNYEATTKMKKYLSQAFEQTKINPNPKETVRDYLMRAIATIFNKR